MNQHTEKPDVEGRKASDTESTRNESLLGSPCTLHPASPISGDKMKRPWSKFFWADYFNDQELQQCSAAAQGLWMRLLCLMGMSREPGVLLVPPSNAYAFCQLNNAAGDALLKELVENEVASTDSKGRLCNRRMMREYSVYVRAHEFGKHGGNPLLKDSQKPEARSQKLEARGGLRLPLRDTLNPTLKATLNPPLGCNATTEPNPLEINESSSVRQVLDVAGAVFGRNPDFIPTGIELDAARRIATGNWRDELSKIHAWISDMRARGEGKYAPQSLEAMLSGWSKCLDKARTQHEIDEAAKEGVTIADPRDKQAALKAKREAYLALWERYGFEHVTSREKYPTQWGEYNRLKKEYEKMRGVA